MNIIDFNYDKYFKSERYPGFWTTEHKGCKKKRLIFNANLEIKKSYPENLDVRKIR